MRKIGLTGGISSGKSTVVGFLKELGVVVIDTDRIGHEVLKSDDEAQQQVVATFGRGVLGPDGSVSRHKLGESVFGNPEALARLNRITHPRIEKIVLSRLEEYRREGVGVVVLEIPLLFEVGWDDLVDEVWVTVASQTTVLKRLTERGGLSEKQALARIRSQMTDSERLKRADVVIDTDTSLTELKKRVGERWAELTSA